jgi:hypothetical protein
VSVLRIVIQLGLGQSFPYGKKPPVTGTRGGAETVCRETCRDTGSVQQKRASGVVGLDSRTGLS